MRLLYFAQAFQPRAGGGSDRLLHELASRLTQRGHEVIVLASRARGESDALDLSYRLLRYRKPFALPFLPSYTVAYQMRAHGIERPNCAHAHGTHPAGFSMDAYSRGTGVPWALFPTDGDLAKDDGEGQSSRRLERTRRTLLGADRVIAPSPGIEQRIAAYGVREKRIARLPAALNLARAETIPRNTKGARSIVSTCSGGGATSFFQLLEAFERVYAIRPEIRLQIAGLSSGLDELEVRVRAAGLTEVVRLHGVLEEDERQRLLAQADVFVSCASHGEGEDALLEALAAGLPILLADTELATDLVKPGANGELLARRDSQALASSLLQLLADSKRREEYGRMSQVIASLHSWELVLPQYEAMYDSIAR